MRPDLPSLPAGCAWTSDVEHAHEVLATGGIPIPLPEQAARAQRWARVLHWYTPTGHQPPPAPADAIVASIATCHPLGALAATALNRPHHHAATLEEAAVELNGARSILLTIPTHLATWAHLAPTLTTWAASGTHAGLLTGRDTPGAGFQLSKILAATAASSGHDILLDGLTGRARPLTPDAEKITLAGALTGDWNSTLIDAHGSAAHAWLGTHVLCGLTHPREHTATGHVLPGGCTSDTCKLAPHHTPVHPHNLRTRLLGMTICNAITLHPREQYPSDLSLALDALEGYPAAIFGLARGDAETTTTEPAVAAHLLRAGTPLGHLVHLLNQASDHRGTPTAYLALGDPEHTQTPIPGATIPALDLPADPGLPVLTSATGPRSALIAGGRALLAEHDPTTTVRDLQRQATSDLADITGWHQNLTEAHLLEEALLATSARRRTTGAQTCLETMYTARTEATGLLLDATRAVQNLRAHRTPGYSGQPTTRLEHLADQWARAVIELATEHPSAWFGRLDEALTAHHHATARTTSRGCSYCHTPLRERDHTSPLLTTYRTSATCPRCGPTTNHPGTGTRITLTAGRVITPGQRLRVTATLTPSDSGAPNTGLLALQLRPRSTSTHAYTHTRHHLCPGEPTTTTELTIPDDVEPELHRLWALHAHRFQLSLALHRIPAITPSLAP